MRASTVFLASLYALHGLAAASPAPSAVLTAADEWKTVGLKRGQALQVVLEANHTTGYSWALEKTDPSLIQVTGQPEYTPSQAKPGMSGVGGTETWRLVAIAAGQQPITFVYRRPFEPSAPPARKFSFRVQIQP